MTTTPNLAVLEMSYTVVDIGDDDTVTVCVLGWLNYREDRVCNVVTNYILIDTSQQ